MSVKPIFFALDGITLNEFEFELNKLKGHIYGVKVGLQLFISEGPKVVEKLKNQGWTVFLDLKLHDIPNTVKEATKSASAIGADYLTIHIASSSEALYEATVNKGSDLKILGVSNALTSKAMSEEISNKVNKEFTIAKENGVDGVICPSSEIAKTKELFELIVTPGIRLENEQQHDQKNISTPQFALNQGATFLVMGRSIRKNLNYIINELQI
jgi:orotidine-5'-phosphate decarboxylase